MMLHDAKDEKEVSEAEKKAFRKKAEELLDAGAVGLGEIAIMHLSLDEGHPYECVAGDHPLLLLLSDIAAERDKPLHRDGSRHQRKEEERQEHEAPLRQLLDALGQFFDQSAHGRFAFKNSGF